MVALPAGFVYGIAAKPPLGPCEVATNGVTCPAGPSSCEAMKLSPALVSVKLVSKHFDSRRSTSAKK